MIHARRPPRNARVEAKVSPATFDAVQAFAIANHCSTSSAVAQILLEWERGKKGPPVKVARLGPRDARLETLLEQWLCDALKAWAQEHGLTVSTALNAIVVAWVRAERKRVRRRGVSSA